MSALKRHFFRRAGDLAAAGRSVYNLPPLAHT
jgi:hypothetical protein